MSLNFCAAAAAKKTSRGTPFLLSEDPDQVVTVKSGGVTATTVLRRQLIRFEKSVPYEMFKDGSVYLGNTVRWKKGCWEWDVRGVRSHDAAAVAEVITAMSDPTWSPRGDLSSEALVIASTWRVVTGNT